MPFPALTPSSRTWSPGAYPATAWMAINGSEARVRHSTVLIDSELRLTFLAISEADMLALLAHYLQVIGTWTTFTLPGAVWSGVATPSDYLLTGYAWRYSSPPEVVDLACGGHDVTVALRSVVPEASVGPGAELVVRVSIAHAAPVVARGATLTVQALLAGGAGVGIPQGPASGAALTVAASIAGGTASGNVAAGADLTVAASIAGGAASSPGDASGATLTVTASIIGGDASSPGNADGAALSVAAALLTDGASGNVAAGSDLTATASIVGGAANSPGTGEGAALTVTASIIGGTATGATDPSFSSVSLLLHMNGSNNSTTFTDSSSNVIAMTRNGDAKISTAQSKFGGASGAFDGTGDFLTCPTSSGVFSFGSGVFTVEAWVWIANTTGIKSIASIWPSDASASWRFLVVADTIEFIWRTSTGSIVTARSNTGGIVPASTWTHVAAVRHSGTVTLYAGGSSVGSETVSGSINNPTSTLSVGRNEDSNTWFMNGYIDDLRITKGVARYTANFTPPSAPFPDS